MSAPVLLEIGMEECPARFITSSLGQMSRLIQKELESARLAHGEVTTYGTPRRLTVQVQGVSDRQSDLEEEVKGPPARIAYDDNGNPTRAAQGFAAKQGVDVDDLVTRETGNGDYLYAVKKETGQAANAILPEVLVTVINSLRFPKSMRWSDESLRFARPIRWIAALLGDDPISFQVGDVQAEGKTRGHRFFGDDKVTLKHADEYVKVLEDQGAVIVEVDKRRESIRRQVVRLAESVQAEAVVDEDLLDEVTQLVEYPTALLGTFDKAYLGVPQEILVTSMKEHQKYFPVSNNKGELMPHFIAVRNGGDEHLDIVRAGNEKVLSARLADAKFFYDEDLKKPIADRTGDLKGILFQEQLGTVWEKVERIRGIIRNVADTYTEDVIKTADRAALLAKADLVSHVVNEFPELQGMMGKEYAVKSGETPEVAQAIYEHYLPRHAQDALPETEAGILVSIADKIDTIVGCFGIGFVPTGSTDPYALRRQALGIIRIQLQHRLPITLGRLIDASLETMSDLISDQDGVRDQVLDFFKGRLNTLLLDRGIRHDLVDASLARGVGDLLSAEARAEALAEEAGSETFEALRIAYERAVNLSAKATGCTVNSKLFEYPEEEALWRALDRVQADVEKASGDRRFKEAIAILAELRGPVDAFFETVLVMAEDEAVRENRLSVLVCVVDAFEPIGDLSCVAES